MPLHLQLWFKIKTIWGGAIILHINSSRLDKWNCVYSWQTWKKQSMVANKVCINKWSALSCFKVGILPTWIFKYDFWMKNCLYSLNKPFFETNCTLHNIIYCIHIGETIGHPCNHQLVFYSCIMPWNIVFNMHAKACVKDYI